jgi:ABC-type branched-subunit amino acid transport system substrate-binding protein
MPLPSAETVTQKWLQKAGASGQTWLDGINSVTTAPGQLAIAQGQKWRDKMASQDVYDKWRRKTGSITNEQWKSITTAKGTTRYTSGIQASADKYRQAIGKVLTYEEQGLSTIRAMPNVTLEDAIARSNAWVRWMAKYSGS